MRYQHLSKKTNKEAQNEARGRPVVPLPEYLADLSFKGRVAYALRPKPQVRWPVRINLRPARMS